jgi:DNA-binding NtrC family response regulator
MSKRLLIIDDNISVIATLAPLFEDFGYNVTIIDDGHRAIELAKQSFYDLVIIDINMPGINGVETFKAIKEISPATIAIMMTAGASKHLIEQAMDEGAFGIVYKPFRMNEIIDMVGKAIERTVVLIVDDQIEGMKPLKYLLEEKGYRVIMAYNGPKAVEIINHGRADIALVDIRMPEMDGFTVAQKIREIDPDTGIIMMTAHNDENTNKELESSPFTCLYKPMDIKRLIEAVEKVSMERLEKAPKPYILIVEDNAAIGQMVSIALQRVGFETFAVQKGQVALEEIRKKVFHVAIIDYKLPDMTGMDVVKGIKNVSAHTKIIMMTAHAKLDMAIEAIKEHIFDFLVKPVELDDLLISVKKAVAKQAE